MTYTNIKLNPCKIHWLVLNNDLKNYVNTDLRKLKISNSFSLLQILKLHKYLAFINQWEKLVKSNQLNN